VNIAWLSNAPWGRSGYGEQTALFCRRLGALGHDVSILANHGLQEVITSWEGMTVYPADGVWGNATVDIFAENAGADIVIALMDAFVLHPDEWPDVNMAVWAPVDHYPIPPKVLKSLAHPNIKPIAMSRNGEKQMRDVTLNPLYVPHGYDPKVFKPAPELRDTIRDTMKIPRDAFLVGMVAANRSAGVSRKAFPQAFHAFGNLCRTHKDAYIYIHCDPLGGHKGNYGMDLEKLRKMVGIPPDRIMHPTREVRALGMAPQAVAHLYAAFDVLLLPSMGEGFGVPLIEAQACGTPVITSNHSAMTELGQAGWLVQGDPWWDQAADSFFFVPFIQSITDALEQAYEARGDPRMRSAAVEFAQPYNADLVTVDYWMPALERLEEWVDDRRREKAVEDALDLEEAVA
jgi:glycosyltransferase involved in cell wall biosynthesis